MFKFNNSWMDILKDEFQKDYFKKLYDDVLLEYENNIVYPEFKDIFTAFDLTSFEDVKVVIIGQDPYHNENEAHGLSFSVKKGVKIPPSLKNIYKEIEDEFNIEMPKDFGDLSSWAKEGVLLLNTSLTVRKNQPASHKNIGWETFTDEVIKKIDEKEDGVVFILWGAFSQKKKKLIKNKKHLILESVHPSPLSSYRGFFGNKHFLLANEYLKENNKKEINWQL